MSGEDRSAGCGCIILVVVALIALLLGLTMCTDSRPSPTDRMVETARKANAEAELKQQNQRELKNGVRSDGLSVSAAGGDEMSSFCFDGEKDDSSGQGILDIDTAEANVVGDWLVIEVTLFPVLKEGLLLYGDLKLVSATDPGLWISYSSRSYPSGGRVATDSIGNEKVGPLSFEIENSNKVKMTVPVEDSAELGDTVFWSVRVSGSTGPTDKCPNSDSGLLMEVAR